MKSLVSLIVLQGFFAAAALGADGKGLFESNKCNRCHAISAEGIEATASSEKMHGPDLGKMEAERTVEWITQYVMREVQKDGKNHRIKFSGDKADLEAIADWVVGLSKASGGND